MTQRQFSPCVFDLKLFLDPTQTPRTKLNKVIARLSSHSDVLQLQRKFVSGFRFDEQLPRKKSRGGIVTAE